VSCDIQGVPLVARAYAKINIGLEVLGRRPDGYHELRTILQTIDLHDEIRFYPRDRGIELSTRDLSIPAAAANLAYVAASLVTERLESPPGILIDLEKRIPPGMGLGGGSADAAATLLALNRLWSADIEPAELHRMAAGIGMDVPFFLHGGTALVVGRGDEIYPLDLAAELPIVLILPDFSISTAEAYGRLRLTRREPSFTLQHFAWGKPCVRDRLGELVNDLETATGMHSTSIQEYKRLLLDRGASSSMMSGSGAAVYGVFQSDEAARRASDLLNRDGIRAMATRTITGETYRNKVLSSDA
jgi:4-diphosphocytidyl-2-C-methyl-D-erythritol kinase